MIASTRDSGLELSGGELHAQRLSAGIHHRIESGTALVVLDGRAIVEFEDGEALVYLRRGSMCRFASMSATRWTVSDALELLAVTEASIVFTEHGDDESVPRVDNPHPMPSFRPRTQVRDRG